MVYELSHNDFNSRHRSIPNSCVWYIYENVFTTARVREILNRGLRAEQHQPLHTSILLCTSNSLIHNTTGARRPRKTNLRGHFFLNDVKGGIFIKEVIFLQNLFLSQIDEIIF